MGLTARSSPARQSASDHAATYKASFSAAWSIACGTTTAPVPLRDMGCFAGARTEKLQELFFAVLERSLELGNDLPQPGYKLYSVCLPRPVLHD